MVDEATRKIIKRININDKYYVRREEDSKVYRNVIKIHSDGFTNFSAGPEERHQKKIGEIFQILEDISSESQGMTNLVYCQVLGTE